MTVTFCGHSKIECRTDIAEALDDVIEKLIQEGAVQFLLGGYGQFDSMAARSVARAKRLHPGIESILVIPYIDRKYDTKLYDRTLFPNLECVPRRFAISRRNRYMVDAADIVVAYVDHEWGGAAATLEYARRKKKRCVCLQASSDVSRDGSF